jgi:hypothetical protein
MLKSKIQNYKLETQNFNLKVSCHGGIPPHFKLFAGKILSLLLCFYALQLAFCLFCYAQEKFVYDAGGKRNPFMPLVTSDGRLIKFDEEKESEIILEGIIYDDRGMSYAIVNHQVVKIGDWAGNYRVFKIEKDKVTFLKDNQPIEVRLKKEEE